MQLKDVHYTVKFLHTLSKIPKSQGAYSIIGLRTERGSRAKWAT